MILIHGKIPLIVFSRHFAVEPWLSDSIWILFSSVRFLLFPILEKKEAMSFFLKENRYVFQKIGNAYFIRR